MPLFALWNAEISTISEASDSCSGSRIKAPKTAFSDAEEKLLAAFQKERGTVSDIYETFTASDLTFGKIKDENGKEVELTDTNYSLYMKSQNPEVRRSAFKTLYKTYEQYQNTFASIYAGQIEVEKTCAKVRGYKSAMEAALFADDVTQRFMII